MSLFSFSVPPDLGLKFGVTRANRERVRVALEGIYNFTWKCWVVKANKMTSQKLRHRKADVEFPRIVGHHKRCSSSEFAFNKSRAIVNGFDDFAIEVVVVRSNQKGSASSEVVLLPRPRVAGGSGVSDPSVPRFEVCWWICYV